MKKFFLSTAVVAAMAIGYTFSYSDSEPALSDIELANVEALADIEIESGGSWIVTVYNDDKWECKKGGTYKCPGTPW